jgi:hypothetical protein
MSARKAAVPAPRAYGSSSFCGAAIIEQGKRWAVERKLQTRCRSRGVANEKSGLFCGLLWGNAVSQCAVADSTELSSRAAAAAVPSLSHLIAVY